MPELWERSQYFRLSHGAELYAHIVGHGEPLLMIPGFGCNHYPFEGISKPLSEHFKLIMIHNRGMGLSSPATKHYELEDLARDAIEVMAQLGYDKFSVLGISLGGLIAEEVALLAPEKIIKLCLLCTTGAGKDFVELKPFSEAGLIDFYEMDPMERSVLLTEATVDQNLKETRPERFNQIVKLRFDNRADLGQVIIQNSAAIKYLAKKKDLSIINAPTLVLTGDQDRTVSPQNSIILGKIISRSKVAVISGTDHMFALEKPLLTATHIEDFLSPPQ
jgi:3-oxoadipate enol-lactonase